MSGGEKRILKINEDLFKFPDRKTKKKQDKNAPRIQLKSSISAAKNKTLRRSVLNLIRQKQKEEYDKLFDEKSRKSQKPIEPSTADNFKKDFKESFEYLSSLVEKTKDDSNYQVPHNNTFKRYPNSAPNSVLLQPDNNLFIATNENVNNVLPNGFCENPHNSSSSIKLAHHAPTQKVLPPPPKYGCLKNGSLPTYRTWYNNTQRALPNISGNHFDKPLSNQSMSYQSPPLHSVPLQSVPLQSVPLHSVPLQSVPLHSVPLQSVPLHSVPLPSILNTPKIRDSVSSMEREFIQNQRKNEILQTYEKTTVGKKDNKVKYLKRKKIYKRTYRVGKSKIAPRVGVLVSNKTIRSKIITESQKMKSIPMVDVRKFLIKRGLIKVGSSAPDHVLRKMYESMFLICGEVQNHNPENLLYNFIHDTE